MDRIKMQDLIVANVFPTTIRNRLYDGMGKPEHADGNFADPLDIDGETGRTTQVAPMADLFPDVTIIFADIVGFTAWSSAREPQQVFTLLETIYAAIDRVAYRHNVFKVETVGDCYVAATGVPEPMEDHAGECNHEFIDIGGLSAGIKNFHERNNLYSQTCCLL